MHALNSAGAKGWELAFVAEDKRQDIGDRPYPWVCETRYTFKRQLPRSEISG